MLAQSFMTAQELKITDVIYEALTKTLVELEIGNILFAPRNEFRVKDDSPYSPISAEYAFNMTTWAMSTPIAGETTSCGTVCCIGGLSCQLMGMSDRELYGQGKIYSQPALHELFYPGEVSMKQYNWQRITPEIAAKCLRKYLETGIVNWTAALA